MTPFYILQVEELMGNMVSPMHEICVNLACYSGILTFANEMGVKFPKMQPAHSF